MISFLIVLGTFLAMEFVSWATHKYIMHGFLWYLHKDHHQVDHKKKTQKKSSNYSLRQYKEIKQGCHHH